MTRKVLSILLSLCLILTLFTACSDDTLYPRVSNMVIQTRLPLSGISVGDADYVCAYKNIVFAIENGELIRYNLVDGDKSVIAEVGDAVGLTCSGNNLAVLCNSSASIYTYAGEKIQDIPLSGLPSYVVDIALNGEYLCIASDREIYSVNLSDGSVNALGGKWDRGISNAAVTDIGFSVDGNLYINYVYNYDLAGGFSSTTVEYNISDDTVGDVNDYQATVSNGCLTLNGDYYYFRTNTVFDSMKDLSQTVIGVSSEDMNTGIHRVDTEGLAKLGIAPCDVRNTSDGGMYVADEYSVEYADGNNFVVWDITAGTVFGFGYDEENVLTIVTRNDGNTYGIESLVNAYIAKTGKQIRIKEYSADRYDSVIRTKLMAEDNDFDMFIADESMLVDIIYSDVYEPLDGYQGIADNFDSVLSNGAKTFLCGKNGIFGIPLSMNAVAYTVKSEYYSFDDMTVDDMFNLCDSLVGTGKKLFSGRYMLNRIVFAYIDDMASVDGKVNVEELSDLFAKLKYYNDLGVLCDTDAEAICGFSGLSVMWSANLVNDGDGLTCINVPSRGESRYVTVNSAVLVNRSSALKEDAAAFLEYLSNEKNVYDNEVYAVMLGKNPYMNSMYSEQNSEAIDFATELLEHSRLSLVGSVGGFTELLTSQIIPDLLDGNITPASAAETLAQNLSYKLFEAME